MAGLRSWNPATDADGDASRPSHRHLRLRESGVLGLFLLRATPQVSRLVANSRRWASYSAAPRRKRCLTADSPRPSRAATSATGSSSNRRSRTTSRNSSGRRVSAARMAAACSRSTASPLGVVDVAGGGWSSPCEPSASRSGSDARPPPRRAVSNRSVALRIRFSATPSTHWRSAGYPRHSTFARSRHMCRRVSCQMSSAVRCSRRRTPSRASMHTSMLAGPSRSSSRSQAAAEASSSGLSRSSGPESVMRRHGSLPRVPAVQAMPS